MAKYSVIHADPAWEQKAGRPIGKYEMKDGRQAFPQGASNSARDTSFPSMSVAEIKALDVQGVSADDCVLYLWATNKYLPAAFEVVKAWGFQYSTTLVWAKNMMGGGLGGTFKINTEYLIFATKGSVKALKTTAGTWFNVKRTYENGAPKHSKKPDFFYDLIGQTSAGAKIDLFARDKREGWDSWGNEIENSIELKTTNA